MRMQVVADPIAFATVRCCKKVALPWCHQTVSFLHRCGMWTIG